MNSSTKTYAAWLMATLLLGAGGLRAAESRPAPPQSATSTDRQTALTRFLLFSWVEFPEDTPAFELSQRRLSARVELRFVRPPKPAVRQTISKKLDEPTHIERHRWADEDRLVIQLTSLNVEAERLRRHESTRPMIALGKKRDLPPLPVWLFDELCPYLFDGLTQGPPSAVELEDAAQRAAERAAASDLVATFCRADITLEALADARPPTEMRELTDLWRLMVYQKATHLPNLNVGEFDAYVRRHHTSPQVVYFARISAAMVHATRNEFDACFEQLDAIERLDSDDEPVLTDWQRQLVADLGEASFSRMVGRHLAAIEDERAGSAELLDQVERFSHWEGVTLPTPLKDSVARMYRQALFPERAVPHYQALLERSDTDAGAVLEQLATTYVEADQPYRAWATLQYLREQHPERRLTLKIPAP